MNAVISPANELQALYESAALFDRSERGAIAITGPDAQSFLQAVLSNDVSDLAPGDTRYALLLNGKGQIRCEFPVIALDDGFLLTVEGYERAYTFDAFKFLRIRTRTKLEDRSAAMAQLALHGPKASAVIRTWLDKDVPLPGKTLRVGEIIVVPSADLGVDGYDILLPIDLAADAKAALRTAGATGTTGAIDASLETYEVARIDAGTPRYGPELNETSLPPEARLEDRAIHYNKGCYPGQEIMARIKNRGQVRQLLCRLEIEGDAPVEANAVLSANGANAGKVTSSAYSPYRKATVALGYVRREFAAPGTTLTLPDGRIARVRS